MAVNSDAAGAPVQAGRALGPRYKWIALSNTTLGMLMATINQSIVLIALPDIFRGIGLNPLSPGNTSYLLWMFMGFLVVSAVLVVSFGRLGDMFGRVRMYTLGFAVFSIASIFLTVTWMHGSDGALWLIIWRVVQGIGGAFLFANAAAIVTDAFPANQRGTALSVNSIAAIAGSFIGLILGGVLAPVNWHLIFLVSAPIGVFGTVWAYFMLHDIGVRKHAQMDWWGNLLFAAGLVAILVGITYGLLPYGGHPMGWTNPWVLTALFGGLALLVIFMYVETKVAEPLFRISLFRIRAFTAGNIASLMLAMGRGGMQFMLIIWLQGIWLPLHGYDFSQTPLWAGIYLVPLTVGFLAAAPLSGILSDKFGPKPFTVGGALLTGLSFLLLIFVPVNFAYWEFAIVIALNGFGSGLFFSPNWAEMMNSVPAGGRHDRHLPELRVRAVDRRLLHLDGGRPVKQAPGGHVQRADRTERPGRHGHAHLAPPPDRRAVRLLPRLQPDAATPRPAAASTARGARCLPGRARVLPAPDHGAVPQRSRRGLRVRHRGQRDRGHRLGPDGPAYAGPCRARATGLRTGRRDRRRQLRARRTRRPQRPRREHRTA
jgi:MFS family permease